MRPRIGVTLELQDSLVGEVERRVREAVEGAGGLVAIVPPSADPASWQAAYERVDGVLLMGGADVDPAHYGAERHPLTRPATVGADVHRPGTRTRGSGGWQAHPRRLPWRAGPRGCRGGSTDPGPPDTRGTRDLALVRVARLRHACGPRIGTTCASERGSRVAALLGDASAVNSYHHQAVDRIGDGMRAVAHAHDGVVEAIEATNGHFAVGLQWHEEFHTDDARLAAVFAALVAAARDGSFRAMSDVPVLLPRLGASMEEAIFVEWLRAEGDHVEADEPICVIETDKVDAEVVAPAAGVLGPLLAAPRETIAVGAELARIREA